MVHVSLARSLVQVFSFGHPSVSRLSPEVWSRRELTAKTGLDRTKTERKLFSMVDNLGSVHSGACARDTLSENSLLTGPLAPVC
eukprot:2780478-Prymnesium_polylepis.1